MPPTKGDVPSPRGKESSLENTSRPWRVRRRNRFVIEASGRPTKERVPFFWGGVVSLPEFMNINLFGKTILVVNKKFGLFVGHPLSQ